MMETQRVYVDWATGNRKHGTLVAMLSIQEENALKDGRRRFDDTI